MKQYQNQIKSLQEALRDAQLNWQKAAAQATEYGIRLQEMQTELTNRPIITSFQLLQQPQPPNHNDCINQIVCLQNQNEKLEYEKWRANGALIVAVSYILGVSDTLIQQEDIQIYYDRWDILHPNIENDYS